MTTTKCHYLLWHRSTVLHYDCVISEIRIYAFLPLIALSSTSLHATLVSPSIRLNPGDNLQDKGGVWGDQSWVSTSRSQYVAP
jgi:hypothetical protein